MSFDFLHPRRSSVRQEEILLRDSEFLLCLLRFHRALYFIHVDARIIAIVAHYLGVAQESFYAFLS